MKGASKALARVATDTDTYIFGGIALVGLGVGAMVSVPLASIVTGCMLIALGVWMTAPRGGSAGGRPEGDN